VEKFIRKEVVTIQKYVPDYLVNENSLIEIKPEVDLCLESEFFCLNTAKIIALEKYCEQNRLYCEWMTEESMKDFMLTTSQIRMLLKEDLMFFKEKHRERFK